MIINYTDAEKGLTEIKKNLVSDTKSIKISLDQIPSKPSLENFSS